MSKKQASNEKPSLSVLIEHDKDLCKSCSDVGAQDVFAEDVFELIHGIDKETSDSILSFYRIKLELKFNKSPKQAAVYQYIIDGISALITKDPHKLHRDIIEAVLNKTEGGDKSKSPICEDKNIQDAFCREYIKQLEILKLRLKKEQPQDPIDDSFFEKDDMFLADRIFLDLIRDLGSQGKIASEEYASKFKLRFKNTTNSISFWFNIKDESRGNPFHVSLALLALAEYIYKDIIKQSRNLKVPAITSGVQKSLEQVLSPDQKPNTIKENRHVELLYQDAVIGSIRVPSTTKRYMAAFKGIHELNSLIGHKILRHIVQSAFDRKVSGIDDFRILHFDRGATEIAEILGIKGKSSISNIKKILYAMDLFKFAGPELTGSLIDLCKCKSSKTHRQDGYLITVLPPLLPYYTFKDGELLIALLPQPPLVGSNQYHAGQLLHAMKLSGEFRKQSDYFAVNGAVKLTKETLQSLAHQSGILDIFEKVHDRLLQDGDDYPQFLERVDTNFYRFGPALSRYNEFYKEQGELRLKGQKGGKISAANRKRQKYKKK